MSFDAKKLFDLLPAIYRIRDTEAAERAGLENGPLKALLSVVAEQVAVIEEDLDQLYDDQFIETCAEWAVPYIGDLIGTRGLITWKNSPVTQRAQVANTLAYRRRKGTAAVLEQLARDVTGWDANVVEFFQLLATSQYMNHVRKANLWSPSMRHSEALEKINSPFDRAARTLEVRNIATRGGKHNIPNIGIYLWRIANFAVTGAPAYVVDTRRYLFSPLGIDTQLFNRPQTEEQITHLAGPFNVPMPISRRTLDRSLEDLYGVDDAGNDKSLLIFEDGLIVDAFSASPPGDLRDAVRVCNLSDVRDAGGNIIGWAHAPADQIAIDPELGRIVFPQNRPAPDSVRVSYQYGFSAEMGGGEYRRAATFTPALPQKVRVPQDRPTIQQAVDSLTGSGVVEIQNNDYLFETPALFLPKGRIVEIRAADEKRPILVLSGPLRVSGDEGSELILNGLLVVGGRVIVPSPANVLRKLTIRHCTFVPGPTLAIGPVAAQPASPRVIIETTDTALEISNSIVGPVRIIESANAVISNSIVDAAAEAEIAYAGIFGDEAGAPVTVVNSTIIGKVHAREITLASNSIFIAHLAAGDTWAAPVWADRVQEGCVRFSFVPSGSRVPRTFKCQPDAPGNEARVRPVFTSRIYGKTAYHQLSDSCPIEIRQGADDGAEMGAFHDLFQPQRLANLRARLDEYLRFGLEAGIFNAS